MARLERWLSGLMPRFKIADSIKEGVAKMKAATTNREEKIESIIIDNIRMRRQISELQNIIKEFRGPAFDTTKPSPSATFMAVEVDRLKRELAAEGSQNIQLRTRLQMLSSQLQTIAQQNARGATPLHLDLLLLDARRTANIGTVSHFEPFMQHPVPPPSSPTTMDSAKLDAILRQQSVTFDDEAPKEAESPPADPKGPEGPGLQRLA